VVGLIAVMRNPTGSPRLNRLLMVQLRGLPGPKKYTMSPDRINLSELAFDWPDWPDWPDSGMASSIARIPRSTTESESAKIREGLFIGFEDYPNGKISSSFPQAKI